MGLRILNENSSNQCLYCSTSDVAFGPVFDESEDVEHFIGWLDKDARLYTDEDLSVKVSEWRQLNKKKVAG